jgi:acyl-coenzyme A synthetase/AMP-(fatty) acid ligase
MLRTIFGDHERFQKTYFGEIEGCYFAGDGARRDPDGSASLWMLRAGRCPAIKKSASGLARCRGW